MPQFATPADRRDWERGLVEELRGLAGHRVHARGIEIARIETRGSFPKTSVVFAVRSVRGGSEPWPDEEWETNVWDPLGRPEHFGGLTDEHATSVEDHAYDVMYHFEDTWLAPNDRPPD